MDYGFVLQGVFLRGRPVWVLLVVVRAMPHTLRPVYAQAGVQLPVARPTRWHHGQQYRTPPGIQFCVEGQLEFCSLLFAPCCAPLRLVCVQAALLHHVGLMPCFLLG